MRKLRQVQRVKEHRCRQQLRNEMQRDRGSRTFWQKVQMFDRDRIREKLGGHVDSPSCAELAAHFANIAIPPVCEWFDQDHRDAVARAVRQSLGQINEGLRGAPKWGERRGTDRTAANSPPRMASKQRAWKDRQRPIAIDEIRADKEIMKRGCASGRDGIAVDFWLGQRDLEKPPPRN